MLSVRTKDNTNKIKAHTVELLSGGGTRPLLYNGKPFPINLLDTFNLQFSNSTIRIKDDTDGVYYDVLHQNSQLQAQVQQQVVEEVQVKKVKPNQVAVVGDNMNIKQSPAPCCYVDENGYLNSLVFSHPLWSDSVMGFTGEGKLNTYAQGLVKAGQADHGGLFLRRDGQWGQPSLYTGSVSETLLSLQDTPQTYQDSVDKYLRVSYAEGGSVVFDSIDTSKVPEQTNLYFTTERAESVIVSKLSDNTLTTARVNGIVEANEFLADSDMRLKEQVRCLDQQRSLDQVLRLRPKSYRFKEKSKTRLGLISQEVKEVVPEVVDTTGPTKKVNYLELIPLLINNIKELKAEVELLKSQK